MFKWNKDGSVENLENPMASSERRGFTDIIEPVASGFGSGILFTIEGKCKDGLCKAIPTTNKLSIRVGYDDNYKTKTGSKNPNFSSFHQTLFWKENHSL